VGLPETWMLVLSRIVLLPVIAALAYEVIYFSGRHADNAVMRVLTAPGRWLQRLTTREPDDAQLEVAIAALKKAVELDGAETT
jgi:uncharacterized protein YqhQ